MELNDEALAVLKPAIITTWNCIYADCDEVESNEECLELCIDANRLHGCGNSPKADKLITELVEEHGYDKVMEFLNDHINLY